MACAFQSLFRLSPKLAKLYQPNLFSESLPALREALYSISLYIRTGHTECSNAEIEQEITLKAYRNNSQQIIDCALSLEEQAEKDATTKKKKKSLWMIVTDSPYIKEWIHEKYGGANHSHRTILTTRARGAHTEFQHNVPSTADFAEAFVDWWLIGESNDAVVSDAMAPNFGNKPSFEPSSCTRNSQKEVVDNVS